MMAAGIFATLLCIVLIVGDWIQFVRLSLDSVTYGFRISQTEETLPVSVGGFFEKFDGNGLLPLSHGISRLFPTDYFLLLRPHYRMGAMRFPTAWPMKASVKIEGSGESVRLTFSKRIPWSSAIITCLWFTLVGVGTLAFLAAYSMNGGMSSLAGMLMGLGITGTGVLVFIFGLIMVSLAYRLENERITNTYQDFLNVMISPQGERSQANQDHRG